MTTKDKLTKKQAAEVLEVKETTLNKYLYANQIRHYKYMGRVYFDLKDIEAFKKAQWEVRNVG